MRIAVVGDIHEHWSEADVETLSASDADLVLFVGDLPGYRLGRAVRIARSLARVRKPAYLIPGNHDGTVLPQLMAELTGIKPRMPRGGAGMLRRMKKLEAALSPIVVCGYSVHHITAPDTRLCIVAGRPHSMGGALNFAPYIRRRFGVESLEASAARLKELVEQTPVDVPLLFLAHNGPTGLGELPESIWGCDFKRDGGDWGDADLRAAIDHAQALKRRVVAVVGGHMHLRTKKGRERTWQVERDGVCYINAARVPRIRRDDSRHHVELEIGDDAVSAREIWSP